jgi:4-diphosphocytidyl-2-C-methyl-D-erythritol kinase
MSMMRLTRNDLQPCAEAMQPVIGELCHWLAQRPGAISARMSGSGATSFGLFSSLEAAKRTAIAAQARGWWAGAGRIYGRAP